jgi:hypothetical protein
MLATSARHLDFPLLPVDGSTAPDWQKSRAFHEIFDLQISKDPLPHRLSRSKPAHFAQSNLAQDPAANYLGLQS